MAEKNRTPTTIPPTVAFDPSRVRKYYVHGDERQHNAVYVEWRGQRYGEGPVLWAVTGGFGYVLGKSGRWEFEPQPSSRTDAFIERCRWTSFDEAYAAALKAVPA